MCADRPRLARVLAPRRLLPALAIVLAAMTAGPSPVSAQASAPFIQIPAEAGYRAVLERHGQFYTHDQYGLVWVPSSLPQGWRPYSDCLWVQHKEYGWLYDDRSEWGRIVHHYGRWAHDERVGWMWLPGAEWSPGWVVWRTGDTHIGWAPMPPDKDVARISVEQFNSDKHWMFRETAAFKAGCGTGPVAAPAEAAHFRSTRVVTRTRFVNGVFVYEVPVVASVIVTFDVGIVHAWSGAFIGAIFGQWNQVWNEVTGPVALLNAALTNCTLDKPGQKLKLPILPPVTPAPAPKLAPPRRADLPPPAILPPPPPLPPPAVTPPVGHPPVPPVVVVPPRPPVIIPPVRIPPVRIPDGPKQPPKEEATPVPPRPPLPPRGPGRIFPRNPDGPVVTRVPTQPPPRVFNPPPRRAVPLVAPRNNDARVLLRRPPPAARRPPPNLR